jgi:hypothetical protein
MVEVHSVHVNVAPSDGRARCLDVDGQITADVEDLKLGETGLKR